MKLVAEDETLEKRDRNEKTRKHAWLAKLLIDMGRFLTSLSLLLHDEALSHH